MRKDDEYQFIVHEQILQQPPQWQRVQQLLAFPCRKANLGKVKEFRYNVRGRTQVYHIFILP